ncbi:MAG: hypothetical protein IBX64_11160 [Actinobacteria bacterium]|nr:hypothetical protein [Actinomycetota bacterium]
MIKLFKIFPRFYKNFLRDVLCFLIAADESCHKAINRLEIAAKKFLERFFITSEEVGN